MIVYSGFMKVARQTQRRIAAQDDCEEQSAMSGDAAVLALLRMKRVMR